MFPPENYKPRRLPTRTDSEPERQPEKPNLERVLAIGNGAEHLSYLKQYEHTKNPRPGVGAKAAKIGFGMLAFVGALDIARSIDQNTDSPSPVETAKKIVTVDFNAWEQLKDYVAPQVTAPPDGLTANQDQAPASGAERDLDPMHAMYAATGVVALAAIKRQINI